MPKHTGLNLHQNGPHWASTEFEIVRRIKADGTTFGPVLRCRFPGGEHREYLTEDLVLQRDAVYPWTTERQAKAARNRNEELTHHGGGRH
jgi:hypothetical protein